MQEMPMLQRGMVVEIREPGTDIYHFVLVVSQNGNEDLFGYTIHPMTYYIAMGQLITINPETITRVFGVPVFAGMYAWPEIPKLRAIIDTSAQDEYLIWQRPPETKEMTVDEISEALGYPVKVIGNKEA